MTSTSCWSAAAQASAASVYWAATARWQHTQHRHDVELLGSEIRSASSGTTGVAAEEKAEVEGSEEEGPAGQRTGESPAH